MMQNIRATFTTLLLTVCLVSISAGVAKADALDQFRTSLMDYFKQLNYIALLVDNSYRIGDVLQADGVDVAAPSATCFPTLKVPAPVKTAIPNFVETESAAMNFRLKLKQIFDSGAAANLARHIEIRFSDLTVVTVPLSDFRQALDRKACPEVAPLVDQTPALLRPGEAPRFVIAAILYGKRSATLTVAPGASLQVAADKIIRVIANGSLKVETSGQGQVELQNDEVEPIAVRPITIPKIVPLNSFDLRGNESAANIEWTPLVCDQENRCQQTADAFIDVVKEWKPKLTEQEIMQ